jgi:hypothetical protein
VVAEAAGQQGTSRISDAVKGLMSAEIHENSAIGS